MYRPFTIKRFPNHVLLKKFQSNLHSNLSNFDFNKNTVAIFLVRVGAADLFAGMRREANELPVLQLLPYAKSQEFSRFHTYDVGLRLLSGYF